MIDGPTYRLSEALARMQMPNWHIAEIHQVAFDNDSFSKNPNSNRELMPIFNTLQEHRFDGYMKEWGGLSEADLETVVRALLDSVLLQCVAFPGIRPCLPASTMMATFSVYKKIVGWTPNARTILEIGPGTGFLPFFLKHHRPLEQYAQIETCQGFYLLQSMVNDFAFPLQAEDRAIPQGQSQALDYYTANNRLVEPPCYIDLPDAKPVCVHYPWWRIGELHKEPRKFDVVTSNANLREFSTEALHDYLSLIKEILKPDGVLICQCLGGNLRRNHQELQQKLYAMQYSPVVYVAEGGDLQVSGTGLPVRKKYFCTGQALLTVEGLPLFEKYVGPESYERNSIGAEPGVFRMFFPEEGNRRNYSLNEIKGLVSEALRRALGTKADIGTEPVGASQTARFSCSSNPSDNTVEHATLATEAGSLEVVPIRNYAQLQQPEYLVPRIQRLVESWAKQDRRVLIYGAGEHTAMLARWTCVGRANLIGVVDSSERTHGSTVMGFNVVSPKEIEKLRPDVILISSAAYQEEIYERLSRFERFGIEIAKLYLQHGE